MSPFTPEIRTEAPKRCPATLLSLRPITASWHFVPADSLNGRRRVPLPQRHRHGHAVEPLRNSSLPAARPLTDAKLRRLARLLDLRLATSMATGPTGAVGLPGTTGGQQPPGARRGGKPGAPGRATEIAVATLGDFAVPRFSIPVPYYRYMTSGRLERPGASIYYEVMGSGPALTFAHGLGGNHMSWWQQVPYLAPRYTCVTFAHRGFAPSRSDNPDPAEFAGDLAGLLDHLGVEETGLVAQSMGGWTCLDFSIRYPHRVWALVMAATSGIVDPNTLGASDLQNLQEWVSANTGVEADLFRRGIHPAAGERMVREQPALAFLYREIDQMSAGLDKNALRGELMAARTLPASRLRELKMPVLFVNSLLARRIS